MAFYRNAYARKVKVCTLGLLFVQKMLYLHDILTFLLLQCFFFVSFLGIY